MLPHAEFDLFCEDASIESKRDIHQKRPVHVTIPNSTPCFKANKVQSAKRNV